MGSSVELFCAWVECAVLWRRVGVTASLIGRQVVWWLGELNLRGLCSGRRFAIKLLGGGIPRTRVKPLVAGKAWVVKLLGGPNVWER